MTRPAADIGSSCQICSRNLAGPMRTIGGPGVKRIVGIVFSFGALALIPSVSRAQSDDWQIITGPGYSFQVPGDWQSRQAPSANARIALSTDSNQAAYAFEASPAVPAGLSSL